MIKLLAARDGDLKQRFKEHINNRVDEKYPPNTYDTSDGCVPETIRSQAQAAMNQEPLQLKKISVSDGKQSVGHDLSAANVNDVFASARPSIVVGESDTSQAAPINIQAQAAFNKISGLQVQMGTEFEHQFNCEYLSRIFPWALNYSCGGPD